MWMELLQNGIVRLYGVCWVLCCSISQPGRAHKFHLETDLDRFLAFQYVEVFRLCLRCLPPTQKRFHFSLNKLTLSRKTRFDKKSIENIYLKQTGKDFFVSRDVVFNNSPNLFEDAFSDWLTCHFETLSVLIQSLYGCNVTHWPILTDKQ